MNNKGLGLVEYFLIGAVAALILFAVMRYI